MFRQTLSPSAALRGENGVMRIDKDGGSQTARRTTRTSYRLSQRLRVASVLVPLTLAFATRSFAGEINSSPTFTVLVFNFRQVPSEILAKAKDEVDSILERAGVHAVWRDCPTGDEPCRKGTGTVFFLAIMAARSRTGLWTQFPATPLLPTIWRSSTMTLFPAYPTGESAHPIPRLS